MQHSLTEADDSDIDRSDDWLLSLPIQNKFGTPAADIQCEDVRHSSR